MAADPNAWQQSLDTIMQYYQDNPTCQEGVTALYQKMQDWNAEHMGMLSLSDTTMGWLMQFGFAGR